MNAFPDFPFKATVFGHETVIIGKHRANRRDWYNTQGCGLVTVDQIKLIETPQLDQPGLRQN